MSPVAPADGDIFEVFVQAGVSNALTHVGSLVTGCPDEAWYLAKETYCRRDDIARLWVVRRGDMIVSGPEDLPALTARTRMPFRQAGYPVARRRDRTGEPVAAPVEVGRPTSGPPSLTALWFALADDLFLLGHRLSRHVVDYIDIEDSLATGSISQEATAHARRIVEQCGLTEAGADAHFFDRPAHCWCPSGVSLCDLDSWPATVVSGLVVAAAVVALAEETLAVDPDPELVPELTAIRTEQAMHLEHWRHWVAALAADEATTAEFTTDCRDIVACAGDLLGGPAMSLPGSRLPTDAADLASVHTRFAALLKESVTGELTDRPTPRAADPTNSPLPAVLRRAKVVRDRYRPGTFL
ncbi:Phenylacetic acid catabolic protein [Actinophytocola sp.]|uniref:Phenylacetic acid catabolic protein n=1 Tax=Actinophytocola sp. TaxID=1872138 RepID=UPI002D3DEBD0|nr:Phenylacetic acid catabolic protein [Actinophytocola sp.]HYQ69794.1 Phenylacetic acid catabolic protein [Actinophytocola sp.]